MAEVVVIGAGPAGASAALTLARMGRHVHVLDDNRGRNASAAKVNGYLTQPDVTPREFRERALNHLADFPHVKISSTTAKSIHRTGEDISTVATTGGEVAARRVVLATGIEDSFDISGAAELQGRGVYQCPYCHGWEMRGKEVIISGNGHSAATTALSLRNVASRISIFGEGEIEVPEAFAKALQSVDVEYIDDPITHVTYDDSHGILATTVTGTQVAAHALFGNARTNQRSAIPRLLGCTLTPEGRVLVDRAGKTSVEAVYAAGDMAAVRDEHTEAKVAVAAASGTRVGIAVNLNLAFTDAFGGPEPS